MAAVAVPAVTPPLGAPPAKFEPPPPVVSASEESNDGDNSTENGATDAGAPEAATSSSGRVTRLSRRAAESLESGEGGGDAPEAPAGGDGAPKPPPAKKQRPDQRRGKWTAPEEAYASLVIDHFINGKAPGCTGGESLRALLAGLLRCTPMRITKKFSRTRMIGKSSFKKTSELTAQERVELDAARSAFLKMGGHKESRKRPRSDADAAQHDWLTSGCDPTAWQFEDAPDHSLHGGVLDLSLQSASLSGSRSWSQSNRTVRVPVAPTACGYATKEGKTCVRVVCKSDPNLLAVVGGVFARHRAFIATLHVDTDPNLVANVRAELKTCATGEPLPRDQLATLERALIAALSPAAPTLSASPAALSAASISAASSLLSVSTASGPPVRGPPPAAADRPRAVSAEAASETAAELVALARAAAEPARGPPPPKAPPRPAAVAPQEFKGKDFFKVHQPPKIVPLTPAELKNVLSGLQ